MQVKPKVVIATEEEGSVQKLMRARKEEEERLKQQVIFVFIINCDVCTIAYVVAGIAEAAG